MTHQEQYIALLNKALIENTFVKLSLANYKGTTEGLKNCYVNLRVQWFSQKTRTREVVSSNPVGERETN